MVYTWYIPIRAAEPSQATAPWQPVKEVSSQKLAEWIAKNYAAELNVPPRTESLFDLYSMWFVRPQLFFHCTLHPIGTVAGCFNRSNEDIPLYLVFFSPFEELHLKTAGIMESKGIHRVS